MIKYNIVVCCYDKILVNVAACVIPTTKTKILHLIYMDNLKLIDEREEELQK
jgi:hypothetical protein